MSEQNNPAGATGTLTLALLSSALGLAATATEADVTGKIKRLTELEPLSALIKDGKLIVLATGEDLSGLSARVKTIEDARTAGIATLSATVDGKQVTYTAEDIVNLAARVDSLANQIKLHSDAATAVEQSKLIALFSADGKVPVNPDSGKAYTADELKKLDVQTLKLLHANTPATVPLSARRPATDGGIDPNLKGAARTAAAWSGLSK